MNIVRIVSIAIAIVVEVESPIACLPHEVTFAVCSVSLVGPLAVQVAATKIIRLPTDQEIRGGGYWEEGVEGGDCGENQKRRKKRKKKTTKKQQKLERKR